MTVTVIFFKNSKTEALIIQIMGKALLPQYLMYKTERASSVV